MLAVHERLHQVETGLAGDIDHALGVVGGHREGLLAQDVFAGPERRDRPVHVHVVRQRDVDGVDSWVGEQRLVRRVRGRDTELIGDGPCLLTVARRDGDDLTARRLADAGDHLSDADVRRRQDPPPHRARHERLLRDIRIDMTASLYESRTAHLRKRNTNPCSSVATSWDTAARPSAAST